MAQFGAVLGKVTVIVSQSQDKKAKLNQKMGALRKFMVSLGAPRSEQGRERVQTLTPGRTCACPPFCAGEQRAALAAPGAYAPSLPVHLESDVYV